MNKLAAKILVKIKTAVLFSVTLEGPQLNKIKHIGLKLHHIFVNKII